MPTNVDKKAKTEIQEDSLIDVGTNTSDKSVDVELPEKDVKEVEEKETKDVSVKNKEESEKVEVEEDKKEDKEGEHEVYSKNVQERINKLTKSRRESERREQAATHYARSVRKENDELKARMTHVDEGYLNEFSERVKSQTNAVKSELRAAREAGDLNKEVEVQQKLAKLAIDSERIRATQEQGVGDVSQTTDKSEIAKKSAQISGEQPRPRPVDPKAESWAKKNTWFGQNKPQTYAAFGIHTDLVEEGFDPTSDLYYTEVDKRLKNLFPASLEKDGTTGSNQPVQTVASANRSAKTGRKTVRLTPSQVAIAKKLGVPLKEYAKHVKEGI